MLSAPGAVVHRRAGECLAAVSVGWGTPAPCCHLSKGLQAFSRAPAHELLICRGFMTRLGISAQPLHTNSHGMDASHGRRASREPGQTSGEHQPDGSAGRESSRNDEPVFSCRKKSPSSHWPPRAVPRGMLRTFRAAKPWEPALGIFAAHPKKQLRPSCTCERHP